MAKSLPLTGEERTVYQWQMWVPDFGLEGQQRLKAASVLVSRCGGLGSVVAYELAAAGIGRLVLAHAGNIKPSDLNRQLLMTHAGVGTPRVFSAQRRLQDLNPRLDIVAVNENVSASNADRLVEQADLVVDCAPLFPERRQMNRVAWQQGKSVVECGMYELEATLTVFVPGRSGCFNCLYPTDPPAWQREFPVFGAVSGALGCLAAMEAIKLIAGFGQPLCDQLLTFDLRDMSFRRRTITANPNCPRCKPV